MKGDLEVPTAATTASDPPATPGASSAEGQIFTLLDLLQLGSGCNPNWKGDGMCDLACNNAENNYDSMLPSTSLDFARCSRVFVSHFCCASFATGDDCEDLNDQSSCEYTNDGECDEVEWCAPGTDRDDCCVRTGSTWRVRTWTAAEMCGCPEDRVQDRVLGKAVSAAAVCP